VRQSPASKEVDTENEEATALEAVTRRQPVKTKEELVSALVNFRVCELELAL
jgi:hypothetical protein